MVFFIHRETLRGQTDGRLQVLSQRQFAVLSGNMSYAGNVAGNARRQRAVDGQITIDFTLIIQIHIGGCRRRRDFAPVDHHLHVVAGSMQHPETTATETR